jgi:hypothetical protein
MPAQLKEFHVGIRILQNTEIQKAVNATAPFSLGSLDITDFDGQKFFNICWRYQRYSLV